VLTACGDTTKAAAGAGTSSAFSEPTSGVRGQVVSGPGCAVQSPSTPCGDAPVIATVYARPSDATAKDPSHAPTTAPALSYSQTDTDGQFEIELPPGTYTLEATTSSSPTGCTPLDVTIEADRFVEVVLRCSSGVR
jgi:hypothetical protein